MNVFYAEPVIRFQSRARLAKAVQPRSAPPTQNRASVETAAAITTPINRALGPSNRTVSPRAIQEMAQRPTSAMAAVRRKDCANVRGLSFLETIRPEPGNKIE